MTHQRLALLLVSALFAGACGGGSGNSKNTYDPNAPPRLADQAAKIADAQPRLADQAAKTADAPPRLADQQPLGSSSTTSSAPSGGGGSCESFCARWVAKGCSLGDAKDCPMACAQVRKDACPDQEVALLDCALQHDYCPDNVDQAISQQIVTACATQAQAFVSCTAASDNNK